MKTVDLRRPRRFAAACAAVAAFTWLAPQHVSAEVANPNLIPTNSTYIISIPDGPAFWSAWEANGLYSAYKKIMDMPETQEKIANFRKELAIVESSLGFKLDGKTLSAVLGSVDIFMGSPAEGKTQADMAAVFAVTDADKLNKLMDLAEKAASQATQDDDSTGTQEADDKSSSPIKVSDYKGVTVKTFEFDAPEKSGDDDDSDDSDDKKDDSAEKGQFVYSQTDGKLILSSNVAVLHKVIDRIKDTPTADTFATFEPYKKIDAALAAEKGQVYLYGNQDAAWDANGTGNDVQAEFMKAVKKYVDNLAPVSYYGASITLAPKEISSYSYGLLKEGTSDTLAMKNTGAEPLKSASYIPEGSLLSGASSLFDAAATYDLIKGGMTSVGKVDGDDIKDRTKTLEDGFGFSIESDLVPAMGNEIGFSLNDVRLSGFIPMVDATLLISVANKEKMQKVVESVEEKTKAELKKQADNGDANAASITTEDFQGLAIKSLSTSKLMGFEPSYVVTDDFLIVGSTKNSLKKSIEAKDGKNLGNSDALKNLGHSISANANALQFVNLGRILDIGSQIMKNFPAAKDAEKYVEALNVLDVAGSAGRIEDGAAVAHGVLKLK